MIAAGSVAAKLVSAIAWKKNRRRIRSGSSEDWFAANSGYTAFAIAPDGSNVFVASSYGATYKAAAAGEIWELINSRSRLVMIGLTTLLTVIHPPALSNETISRIAMVCGSGMTYFNEALSSGADCFITADIKYHHFHEAKGKITLIDPGHAQMEQFVARGLLNILTSIPDFSDIEFIVSEVRTSPVSYIMHQD